MANLPTTEELRKAGEQAASAARTPLLAALGAGDLAAKAVVEALGKVKDRVESARAGAEDLPAELRGRFDAAELRKVVDAYTKSAVDLYQYLAEQGEHALEKLKTQPQVQRALSQVDQAADDANKIADDVLGKVTRRTRETGEKLAAEVEDATEEIAEAVVETGAEVAHEVRATSRKAANRTAARKTKPVPAEGE
ncbi:MULTISPECIES: hypothetical protein [Actinosynnema]|uniref:Heparin-binding hemagglutinin n=1 Tax=Actinosynnema pretiosum TaxID=42197 RepID=A0A290ZHN5_9PSEU|nr:hypothetical protein [Actinosynnema pretiosum]ATE58527.1 hypothetical protein CNX65_33390 [Actinosynnema pretiosum]